VSALKQIGAERIQKALSIRREARKNKRTQKRRKEDKQGPGGPEYGAGKH
jgi:hypothetical protein